MITINQCRVDPTRTKLEINVESYSNADGYYQFQNLYIWEPTENLFFFDVDTKDIGNLAFSRISEKEIVNIDFSSISGLYPTVTGDKLLYLMFTVEWVGENEPTEIGGVTLTDEDKQAKAVVADLSQNYHTKVALLNNLKSSNMNADKLIQLFIYENCFKSSIALERWDDANYYHTLLQKLADNNVITTLE